MKVPIELIIAYNNRLINENKQLPPGIFVYRHILKELNKVRI